MSADAPLEVFVAHAINAARMSTCAKSQRGVVIYSTPGAVRIPSPRATIIGLPRSVLIATGYNRRVDQTCTANGTCRRHCRRLAIHAEQAALLAAGRRAQGAILVHVKVKEGKLVPSGPPSCVECSKLIVAAGISTVWLYHLVRGWVWYSADEFHTLSIANS